MEKSRKVSQAAKRPSTACQNSISSRPRGGQESQQLLWMDAKLLAQLSFHFGGIPLFRAGWVGVGVLLEPSEKLPSNPGKMTLPRDQHEDLSGSRSNITVCVRAKGKGE